MSSAHSPLHDLPLPTGWTKGVSSSNGKTYYRNNGVSQWEHPTKNINEEITKRINELQNGDTSKRIAILVNGGSFNPIHNGHLEMYTLSRAELMKQTNGFHEVLIIYVVSPYNDLVQKIKDDHNPTVDINRNRIAPKIKIEPPATDLETSIAQNIFDGPGKHDRIKICREAFASVDNLPGSTMKKDSTHLSKNMFVWPIEYNNAFSINTYIVPQSSVIYYGLSGSDYSSSQYFLKGVANGSTYYSIMIGRAGEASPTFPSNVNGIFINAGSSIASKNIRPEIFKLRVSLSGITEQTDNNSIVAEFIQSSNNLLGNVPNSILYRLLTYGDVTPMAFRTDKYGNAKYGYMKVRKWLFQQKIQSTRTNVQQTLHQVLDNSVGSLFEAAHYTGIQAKRNNLPVSIKFLQMTTAHALYTEGIGYQTSLLNFANADTVGGGVLKGSTVQEETLCMMAPELYLSLYNAAGGSGRYTSRWGRNNWHSNFYYSSGSPSLIPFTTTDEFTFSTTGAFARNTPYLGCVISAAAFEWGKNTTYKPNFGDYGTSTFNEVDFRNKMIKIIQNIIAVAAFIQKSDVLILGAWGCGAFAPKSHKETYIGYIAELFCHALYSPVTFGQRGGQQIKHKDLFTKVLFPIPDCSTHDIFKKAFKNREILEQQSRVPITAAAATSVAAAAATSVAAAAGASVAGVAAAGASVAGVAAAAGASVAGARSHTNPQILNAPNLLGTFLPPSSPPQPPSQLLAHAIAPSDQHPPPYLTITNIVANIDTSIDNFVERLSERSSLKEISVNEPGRKPAGTAPVTTAGLKFARVDGDYPKNTVPLYEQMVYHRTGSTNLKPLEIFIPTRYKINFEQIRGYFKDMALRNDPETQELMDLVINAYGNTPTCMYYKHTIPGKLTIKPGAGAGTVAAQSSSSGSVFDLDPKTAHLIQFKIDKWHNNYIDWCFYRNATRFFVENQELPKDEMVTLKIEFDEVFDANGELLKLVDEIGKKHEEINTLYTRYGELITHDILAPVVAQYIKFFKVIYEDIKKHMPDTLDFIRGRQRDLYDYRFDEDIKTTLFKTYSDIKDILDSFGDNIAKYPYLKLVSLFQIFTKQIDALNRAKFPTKLKEAFDSSIAQNVKTDQREYYKTYTLIQYVYWLLSNSPGTTDNPFKNNYDNSSPFSALLLANIKNGDELYPHDDEDAFREYKKSLERIKDYKQQGNAPHGDDERKVDKVEKEKKHVRRLIEIYKKNITDDNIKNFVEDYMISEDNRRIASYEEVLDEKSIKLKFGIDLLFYVLYFTTNKVVTFIKTKKELFDKIDDKNGDLQVIRQEIQFKESKLTHVFGLISKLIGVPVERIIPDRINYYASNTNRNAGLIDDNHFQAAWHDRISVSKNPTDISKKVKYITNEMRKGLDKALGIVDDVGGTDPTKIKENDKKMRTNLLTLLEHNTVQVVHMLFAKPRDIWYSPDLRLGEFSASPKWSFFRLENPEIISKTASKYFQKMLDNNVPTAGGAAPQHRRLDYILDKSLPLPTSAAPGAPAAINYNSVFKIEIVNDDLFKTNRGFDKKPLCVFIVATQPSPQMLAPGKDSANEARFQNQVFSIGEKEPSTNNDDSVGNKLMEKLIDAIKPHPEKCSNVRGLIRDQSNELSLLTMDALKEGGVDMSIQMNDLKKKMVAAASATNIQNFTQFATRITSSSSQAAAAAAASPAAGTSSPSALHQPVINPISQPSLQLPPLPPLPQPSLQLPPLPPLPQPSLQLPPLPPTLAAAAAVTVTVTAAAAAAAAVIPLPAFPKQIITAINAAEAEQQKWQQKIIDNDRIKPMIENIFTTLGTKLQQETDSLLAFNATTPLPHVDQQMYRNNIGALDHNNNTRLIALLRQLNLHKDEFNREDALQKNTITLLTQATDLLRQIITSPTPDIPTQNLYIENIQNAINILNTSDQTRSDILNNMVILTHEWDAIIAENNAIQDQINMMLQQPAPPPLRTLSSSTRNATAAAVAAAALSRSASAIPLSDKSVRPRFYRPQAAAAAVPSVVLPPSRSPPPPSSPPPPPAVRPRQNPLNVVPAFLEGINTHRELLLKSLNDIFSELNISLRLKVDIITTPKIQNDEILIKQFVIDDIDLSNRLSMIETNITNIVQASQKRLDTLIRKCSQKYAEYNSNREIRANCVNAMKSYDEIIKELRTSQTNVDRRFDRATRLLTSVKEFISQYQNPSVTSIQSSTIREIGKPIHDFALRFGTIGITVTNINDEIKRYPHFETELQQTKAALLECVRRLNMDKLAEINQKLRELTANHKPILDIVGRLRQNPLLQDDTIMEM